MQLTHCIKCQYDLTAIPGADICPECGTANRATLERRAAFVQWNDPRDSALLILAILGGTAMVAAIPKLGALPFVLLGAIFVFDGMSVPERAFTFVKATKTLAIASGIMMLVVACFALMTGWTPL